MKTEIYCLKKDTNEDKGYFVFVTGETEEHLTGIGIVRETGRYKISYDLYQIDKETIKEGGWEKVTPHEVEILKEYIADIKQLTIDPLRTFLKENKKISSSISVEVYDEEGNLVKKSVFSRENC